MSSFEFINQPIMPGQPNNIPQMQPQNGFNNNIYQQQQMFQNQMIQQQFKEPEISMPAGGYGFTVVPDEPKDTTMMLPAEPIIMPPVEETKKRTRRKKQEIIKADDKTDVEVINSVAYTYDETTNMLHETIGQIDMVAAEIKDELDRVKLSKTFRNKHSTMVGLASSLGDLLSTKVSAISQINSSISKANELDYKKDKDRKQLEANSAGDDKYIMDMYNAFIKSPAGINNPKELLGPDLVAITSNNNMNNIIRNDIISETSNNSNIADAGYLSYLANMTPEQNMMFYESNPNIKNAVIYDAATGNKTFQVVDITTGEAVPNVPNMDNRFLEDTYIDLKTKTARNNNLRETYPVIVINENIVKEY